MTDLTDELFDTVRAATSVLYPEARIPETPMPTDEASELYAKAQALYQEAREMHAQANAKSAEADRLMLRVSRIYDDKFAAAGKKSVAP